MPGILEINAVEYYRNETEDDLEAGTSKDLYFNRVKNYFKNVETKV